MNKHVRVRIRSIASALVVWLLWPSVVVGEEPTPKPRPRVALDAVREHVLRGRLLNACVVSAEDIGTVLKEIAGSSELTGREHLWISKCVIDGDLAVLAAAKRVPVEKLPAFAVPDRLVPHIQDLNGRSVRVVTIPVSLRDVEMSGRLRLGLGRVPRHREVIVYPESVSIRGGTVGGVEAEEVAFLGPFRFGGVTVNGRTVFRQTLFAENGSFWLPGRPPTVFKGPVDFDNAIWLREAVFTRARFEDTGSFRRAVFHGTAYFSGAKTIKTGAAPTSKDADNADDAPDVQLTFEGVRFRERAYFDKVELEDLVFGTRQKLREATKREEGDRDTISPRPTVFERRAIFRHAKLDNTRFTDVEFHDHVDFQAAHFTREVHFDRATFERDADFRGARFSGKLFLTDTRFE